MPERTDTRGFVFAATGTRQCLQARRAARTLRRFHPLINIDLFADVLPQDAVFAREHLLAPDSVHPVLDALRLSRFDRTVCLAPETVVLIQIDALFRALEDADFLASPEFQGSWDATAAQDAMRSISRISSRVLGMRRTENSVAALEDWAARLTRADSAGDDRALTETLATSTLRFRPLGVEYNLRFHRLIEFWNEKQSAPRILCAPELLLGPGADPSLPVRPREVLGPRLNKRLHALLALARLRLGRPDAAEDATRRKAWQTLRATSRRACVQVEAQRRVPAEVVSSTPSGPPWQADHTVGAEDSAPFVASVLALAAGADRLHVCCVGGRTRAAEAPLVRLFATGLAERCVLTIVEPVLQRQRALAQMYRVCSDVRALEAAVGVGAQARLHVVRHRAAGARPGRSLLRGASLQRARDLASPHWYRARQLARTLFAEAPAPRSALRELTVPAVRLAAALREADRPGRVDVLLVGRDGVGRRALRACQLGRTRPALVYSDVEDLNAMHVADQETLLRQRYHVSLRGGHLLAVRKERV